MSYVPRFSALMCAYLCVRLHAAGVPPVNDTCTGALLITCSSVTAADTTASATDPSDPGFSCHNGGAGSLGVGGIWFRFVAADATARLHTCASVAPADDSLLAVYSGTCGALAEIGCDDDEAFCIATDFGSDVTLCGLTVGETYYVQLAAWTESDRGVYQLDLQCPAPSGGITGACCMSDGTCADGVAESCCQQGGGSYLGDGSHCATSTCAQLVGQWDGYSGTYADIWVDGDYAYAPNWGLGDGNTARVHIIDISNPTNPVLDNTFFLPSPNEFTSPQDVKVAGGLLFIGLEGGAFDAVAIVDVRNPTSPSLLTTIRTANFTRTHNVFYDNGFLYMADSSTPRVGIVDLRGFDPNNPPPSPITQEQWVLDNVGTSIVHDITVRNGRLYAAAWSSGLWVYDVTDVANSMPTLIGSTPGTSTHSVWPTDDGNFVVTGEERTLGGITVYEITDTGGALSFTQTDSLVLPEAFSVHNQVVIGHRLYNSWYEAGLQVFDIDPATGLLQFVAVYDSSPPGGGGFVGNWGVYPFLGDDRIVLSDMENGVLIVDITGGVGPVPTIGTWGLIVLTCALLCAGTIVIRRRAVAREAA